MFFYWGMGGIFLSDGGKLCFCAFMRIRMKCMVVVMLLALTAWVHAGGKPTPKFSATFHIETDGMDNPKMIFRQLANGKERVFRRMPEIGTRDIETFQPIPSDMDEGYGVMFKLNSTAAQRLTAITHANIGKCLVARLNGRLVDGVILDKPITDGVLVIWRNVSLNDINLMDESIPRFGETKIKKKVKQKKQSN